MYRPELVGQNIGGEPEIVDDKYHAGPFTLRCMLFALGSDGCSACGGCCWVQEPSFGYRFHRVVEFIHERYTGWQVQLGNVVIGNTFEMFDQCAQRIAVGNNEYGFTLFQLRDNVVVPVWQQTGDNVFETFSAWQVLAQVHIALVTKLGVLVVISQGRWWGVVGTPPFHELFF